MGNDGYIAEFSNHNFNVLGEKAGDYNGIAG
jgi:hypothetical protein